MKLRASRKRKRYESARIIVLVTISVIATAVVVGLERILWTGVEGRVNESAGSVTVSLRLQGAFGPKVASEIFAESTKLFERNGISVELRGGNESVNPITSVISEVDTLGVTDSIAFLNARASGQPIIAVAAGFLESAVVFYALEKSGIKAPQDFIGKRVGRQPGSNGAILYDAMLKKLGLSRSEISETGTETGLDALLNDRVDVIPGRIGEEGFLLHKKGVPFSVIRVSDYGIHIPDTVYFTTEKFLRDRPSVVERFLESIIAGWKITYADLAKSVPLIAAASKDLTPEQVEFELATQRDFVMPLGRRVAEFDEQQWKQLRDILASARVIDGSVDLKRAVNYDILKEVYRKPISFGN